MSTARSLVLLLLIGLVSGCSAIESSNEAAWNAAPPPAGDRLQEGKLHFERGNYALAVTAYRASLRDNSSSVRALNGLAASYDRLGRFDLSRRYYQRALEIDPHSAQTLNNMGYSLILEAIKKKGDSQLTAQAKTYLQQASRSDGRHPSIIANLTLVESGPVPLTAPRELRKPLLAMKEPDRYGAWVERRSKDRQLLVTNPSKTLVADLKTSGAKPAAVASSPIALVTNAPVAPSDTITDPLVQASDAKGALRKSRQAGVGAHVRINTGNPALPLTRKAAAETRVAWTQEARTKADRTLGLVTDRPSSPVAVVEARAPAASDGPKVARLSGKSQAVETTPPQDLLVNLSGGPSPAAAKAEPRGETGRARPVQLMQSPAQKSTAEPKVTVQAVDRAPRNLLANLAAGDARQMAASGARSAAQSRNAQTQPRPVQLASSEPLSLITALNDGARLAPKMPSVPIIHVRQASLADLAPKSQDSEAPTFKSVTVTLAPETIVATSAPLSLLAQPETAPATAAPVSLLTRPEPRGSSTFSYTLEVTNGSERPGMAQRFARYLANQGVEVTRLSESRSYGTGISTLRYRDPYQAQAEDLLRILPVAAVMIRDDDLDADLRLGLGNDLLYFDTKWSVASRPN